MLLECNYIYVRALDLLAPTHTLVLNLVPDPQFPTTRTAMLRLQETATRVP